MSDESEEIVYEEDPDYTTVYADDVILQVGEPCRLVFYQDVMKVGKNGFNNNQKCKRVKFEVRLPLFSTEKLTRNGSSLVQLYNRTLHMVSGQTDADVTNAWWKIHNRMKQTLYDSEAYHLDAKTVQSLTDDLEDLSGRISHSTSEKRNASQQHH